MIDPIAASIDFRIIAPEIALLAAAFFILVTAYFKNIARLAPQIAGIGLLTIRDLLWLAAVIALSVGWWLDHRTLAESDLQAIFQMLMTAPPLDLVVPIAPRVRIGSLLRDCG